MPTTESDRYDASCHSCQAIQGIISLTSAPRILETPHWIVEHGHPTAIRGWLVLVLNRHCAALHDLTQEEFASLGKLMRATCRALHTVLNTEKEYVIQFAEASAHRHVHFHVIARLPDWPRDLRGKRVFSGMGADAEQPLSSEEITPLALQIRELLLREVGV